jgi:hypothetical protein
MKHDPAQFHELPAALPDGEHVIWQGKPGYKGLALRSFHIREVAIYFALLMVWKGWALTSQGATAGDAALAASFLLIPAAAAIVLLAGLAALFRRASSYTITTQRIVLHFGVALPTTMNIPLSKIANADLKSYRDGTGDIPLRLEDTKRVSYVLLWPHIRPWRMRWPEPMMISVPDAAHVAAKLADALVARRGQSALSLVEVAANAPSSGSLGNPTTPLVA